VAAAAGVVLVVAWRRVAVTDGGPAPRTSA
jgi:hypothetical protein